MTFKPLAVALAVATLCPIAHAAEGGPDIKISGFGTVAGAISDDGDLRLVRNVTHGKGISDSLDIGADSRLGLQGVVTFQKGFSATAQLVAQRRSSAGATVGTYEAKDFDLAFEWLFAQYQINDNFSVRLGRMQMPAFLLSESLNIGYAAPWLRAPVHLYTSEPFYRLDGVQMNWRANVGGVNLSAQLSHGETQSFISAGVPLPLNFVSDGGGVYGASLTAESGDWTGRLGLIRIKVLPPLPGVDPIKDQYVSLGLQYDNGQALVLSEYAKRTENEQPALGGLPFARANYGYVAAGWRFGSVLPMLIISKGNHATLGATFSPVTHDSRSIGASVRYDVAPNIALKAQLDQYEAKDGLAFENRGNDDHKVRVLTAGFDFVF